ncbi:MAG: fused MFS/spermidine synthase, partial [Gemmatimonadales bacterium]
MIVVLYLLFVLSGAAGLFYESTWARYLGLFVGHDAYAQVIVLVIFLGGMSLGAILAGRRSERLKEPLLAYAVVEGAVGLIGLFFHEIFGAATSWAYSSLFPPLAGTVWLTVAKWGLASLLLLPQSILLGATFPLMSAGVLRRVRAQPGRVLAILYFANSFGAAIGVLVAGFYLLALAGLPGTVVAAAILNLLVAMGAVFVILRERRLSKPALPAAPEPPPPVTGSPPIPLPRLTRVLLAVSFGTAVASFIYEIDWIRMLSLVLGSATHSFELLLSAFILGLALGSFWLRTRADRFANPLRTLGLVQWLMGLLALATLPLYLESFDWTASLLRTFAKTDGGYTGFTLARYAICLVVMLPATFCAGITLPLITRTLLAAGSGERVIGTVYGVNTLGSIVGVALA